MYKLYFWILLFIGFSQKICGQTYFSKIFDAENGLPTSIIYDIQQDSIGNIYASSDKGFFRFNGITYELLDSLNALFSEKRNNLLFSKSNILIASGNKNEKRLTYYKQHNNWILVNSQDCKLAHLYPKIGFIGTKEVLVLPEKDKIIIYPLENADILAKKGKVITINFNYTNLHFSNGKLLIHSNHEAYEYDDYTLTKIFENKAEKINDIAYSLNGQTLYAIGNDWFGVLENNSISKIYIRPGNRVIYKNPNAQLIIDKNNRVFFNLHGFAYFYTPEQKEVNNIFIKNLASGVVDKIFIDRESNYWAVTLRGLGLISSFRFKNFFFHNNNYLNEATTITEYNGYLVVGGNNNIKFLRNDSLIFEHYITDKSDYYGDEVRVSSFTKTISKELFFTAIMGGYGFINPKQEIELFKTNDGSYYLASIEHKGHIFILRDNTLLEIYKGSILSETQITGYGRKLAEINNELFSLGFELIKIKNGKANIIKKPNPTLTFYNAINYNQKTYLATNLGLYELKNDKILPVENDLFKIDSPVFSFLIDSKNNLWVGTQHGIYCISDKKQHFNVLNGLSGNELNRSALYEDSLGNIWIGTETGLSKFTPANSFVHQQNPNIYINNIKVDDILYKASDFPNEIDYEKNSIIFSIIAPNFSTDNKIIYRIKLDENSQWFSASQAELSNLRFVGLKEGEYQLIIEAKNLSNNTYTIIKGDKFTVLPPFYRSNWFRLILILLSLAASYILFQFINQQRIAKALSIKFQKKVKAFEAQEKLFKDVWNVTSEGLIITNLNGKIINANPSFLKGIKTNLEFIVGKDFHSVFVENDTLKSIDSFYKNLVTSENQSKTYEFEINLHGKTKVFETTFNFLDKIDDNEETKIVVSLNDITKRKKTEQEIIESKNKAEIAAKSRSAFLSNMSHEIRTPMNAIIGMTDILISSENDTEKLENLRAIKYSADNLLVIINDILDLSKIESGKFNINPQPFSLQKVTHETVRLLKIKAKRNHVSIDYNIEPEVPNNLIGDAGRLNQILLNLIDNAIKFSPNGKVSISIKNLTFNLTVCELEFRIKDTGIGIPTDQKDLIFENFTQVNNSLTKSIIGTGLGLAITKKLIVLQGGNISVESTPGLGSEFIFNLPFKINQSEFTPEKVEQIQEKTIKEIQSKKILIVEDNVVNQLVVKKLLERYDIKTTIVNNGKECIEILVNSPDFDIILMDIQMPIMDGITATKIIRTNQNNVFKNANIPIIALTADVFEETRKAINESGFNEYMSKPIKEAELIEKIANLVL